MAQAALLVCALSAVLLPPLCHPLYFSHVHNYALALQLQSHSRVAAVRSCLWLARRGYHSRSVGSIIHLRGGREQVAGLHGDPGLHFSHETLLGDDLSEGAERNGHIEQAILPRHSNSSCSVWKPPLLPTDVTIHIDKARREVRVLDKFGVPVNPRTGLPHCRPAMPVLEVEVPDAVAPGQLFTYCIPGHGDVQIRAPLVKRGLEAGLAAVRRHTMLTLAPPPSIGAVNCKYLRGSGTVVLSNGSEFLLGVPEVSSPSLVATVHSMP